uniref:CSON002664 protein n=1 Tax=Culicoides sonorensis TaxID=179676 RepID=A0A336LV05_CULSO
MSVRLEYDEEQWGVIYGNHTGNGVLGAIGKSDAEVTGVAFYIYAKRYNLLKYSFAVQLSQITHVLPKPKHLPFMLTPILPFPPFMWICVVVIFSIAALILLLINKIQRYLKLSDDEEENLSLIETLIIVFKISVYQNVTVKSKAASSLIMFVTLLTSALTIGSLYSGGLSSIMTVTPYEKPVDSIEKLVNTDLKWGMTSINFVYPLEKSTIPAHIEYVKKFIVQPGKDWLIDVNAQRACAMVETMQDGILVTQFYIDKNNSKTLMMLKETLYKEYTALVTSKTWPYMEQLNQIVLMQMESGIRSYWEYQSAAKFLDYEVQTNIEENTKLLSNFEPVKLSVPHITGALILLMIGNENFTIKSENYENSLIEIYSAFPFSTASEPINKFYISNHSLANQIPFIPKINDLEGLEVRGAFLNYPPFCSITPVDPGTGNSNIYGTNETLNLMLEGQEGSIFIEFCKKFNCKISARIHYDGIWGQLYQNHTGNGILGDIARNEADVTGAAFYIYAIRYNLLQYSVVVQLSEITHVLPTPRHIPFLLTPILPFPALLWVFIGFTLILAALIILGFNKIERYLQISDDKERKLSLSETMLTVFKISLFQSVTIKTKIGSSLIMFGTFLVFSVKIGNLYAGGLASIMTVAPYEKPVDSIEKLVNTNLKWGITSINFVYPLEESNIPTHKEYVKKFIVQPGEDWLKDVNAQRAAAMVETMEHGTLVYQPYINKNNSKFLMMLKETLYKEYTALITTKTWPYMEQLNRIVLMQMESGIKSYWEYQSAAKFLDYEVQKNIEENTKLLGNFKPVKLSVPHITGALFLLIFGNLIGTVIFVIEILWANDQKLLRLPFLYLIPLTLLLKFNIWTSNLEESWIEIYSAFPFSKSQTPFNRFFFGNLTLEHDMPFIQNIEDLEGLEIRGAFLHYPPFCAINEVEPGTGNSDIYGSNKQLNLNLEGQEGLIFIEFCKKFNCTITARVDYGENWGAISANRSAGTGILGDIGKNKVDVTGISVYIYAMRYNLLQYSFAVQLSQITHVLPKPQRISFLLTPILPFPPFMWISIVVAFSLAALILLVLNKIQRSLKLTHEDEEDLSFTETIITVLKISVYQNVAVKSKAASSLIMFVTLLASAVTIGSLYAGGLSSIMTVAPYEKPVDSIEKLVNTNLKWGINAISFRYPLEKSTLPAHIKYVKDFVVQPSKDWLIDVNAQKAAPMVEKMQSGTLVYLSYINKNNSKFLMMVKETLYKEYTAVVSTKTWPFMEQLNRIVLMQMESGIRYYWEHQSAAKFLSYEVQKNIEENTKLLGNLEPVKLSVPHITGALLFLLFGYTIGIVTFISEILWGKHRKLLSKPLIFSLEVGSHTTCIINHEKIGNFPLDEIQFSYPAIRVSCRMEMKAFNQAKFMENLIRGINHGCSYFIVSEDCIDEVLEIIEEAHYNSISKYHKKIMTIITNEELKSEFNIESILMHKNIKDLIPSTLILKLPVIDEIRDYENESSIEIYSAFPLSQVNEPSNRFFVANRSLEKLVPLAPVIKDLGGIKIRGAFFNYHPFCAVTEVEPGTGNSHIHGSNSSFNLMLEGQEGLIFIEFCKKYNCTISARIDFNESLWGEIYPNRTGRGVLGTIARNEVDVTGVAFYLYAFRYNMLHYSFIVQLSKVTHVLPKPKPLPFLLTPILPFPSVMWVCVVVAFVFSAIMLLIFNKVQTYLKLCDEMERKLTFIETVITVLKISVYQNVKISSKATSSLIILGTLLASGLTIGSLYSGGLSSVMTVAPYEKPVDSIEKLVKTDLKWGMTSINFVYPIKNSTIPAQMQYVKKFVEQPAKDWLQDVNAQKAAAMVETMQDGILVYQDYITKDNSKTLMMLKETLYQPYTALSATKTWPYMEQLNRIVLMQMESGIRSYWEYQSAAKFLDYEVQKNIEENTKLLGNFEPIKLSVPHITGALFLLILGNVAGILIFIAEILWYKNPKMFDILTKLWK